MQRNEWIAIGLTATLGLAAIGLISCGTDEAKPPAPSETLSTKSPAQSEAKKISPRTPPAAPQTLTDEQLTTTPSGLQLHDFAVGTGDEAKAGDLVHVDYTGWLTDGTLFDSSLKRPQPLTFAVGTGRVIKGWDEGIVGMKVGGKRQLVIPYALAYGEGGRPPSIPPKSTLIFEVELVKVNRPVASLSGKNRPAAPAPAAPEPVNPSTYQTTASGLKFADIKVGKGKMPKAGQSVRVDYTGWIENGTRFDSSISRPAPYQFTVGQGKVIKGWDEAVLSMKVGGKRQISVPYQLAYGERGRPPVIPPKSTLVFDIELIGIK